MPQTERVPEILRGFRPSFQPDFVNVACSLYLISYLAADRNRYFQYVSSIISCESVSLLLHQITPTKKVVVETIAFYRHLERSEGMTCMISKNLSFLFGG